MKYCDTVVSGKKKQQKSCLQTHMDRSNVLKHIMFPSETVLVVEELELVFLSAIHAVCTLITTVLTQFGGANGLLC